MTNDANSNGRANASRVFIPPRDGKAVPAEAYEAMGLTSAEMAEIAGGHSWRTRGVGMSRRGILTEQDHNKFDALIGHVLDDYRAGTLSKADAISGLAELVAAIDIGNESEARAWLTEGRKRLQKKP